jgi:hypothetical protein
MIAEGLPAVHIAQPLVKRIYATSLLTLFFALGLLLVCRPTNAQKAVEAASTPSSAAAMASSTKAPNLPNTPASAGPVSSPHLIASSSPPPEETNRIALEKVAGTDGCKLLVRSTLEESRIWINGKPIGKAPLLLIVPPGKYQVEVVGPRAERTQSIVALLPHETRELTLELAKRYPHRVTLY